MEDNILCHVRREDIERTTSIDTHLAERLIQEKIIHIKAKAYLAYNEKEIQELQESYQNLQPDIHGIQRLRSYTKMIYKDNRVYETGDQRYTQTYSANDVDGGKIRTFPETERPMLESSITKKMIMRNIAFLTKSGYIQDGQSYQFGLHFIRYNIEPGKASYASPTWLHMDDEEMVIVHLVNKSSNLVGGENIIAKTRNDILNVINLNSPFDSLVLTRSLLHAVVPMGSENEENAFRDIILFTIERPELINSK